MRTGLDCWDPPESYDPERPDMGSAWSSMDGAVPSVRRPIGFITSREKPRVRIKAWTQPYNGGDHG